MACHNFNGKQVMCEQSSENQDGRNLSSCILRSDSPYASVWFESLYVQNGIGAGESMAEEPKRRLKRSHRKSRRGCYNCKIRRIKCQETLPFCENCLKRGGTCKYPVPSKAVQLYEEIPIIQEPRSLSPLFTIHDMRLMSHFIVDAHPHLPLDQDDVWTREIPAFAQSYDFLMHAMLALSASHLALATQSDISVPAVAHRQLALQGLNKALSKPLKANDAHAMLAACYSLAFQSSYMADGFAEFITMIRGCALLTRLIVSNNLSGPFAFSEIINVQVASRLDSFPTIDARIIDAAMLSLQQLKPTCDVEEMYYQLLLDATIPLKTSPRDGYVNYTKVFAAFTTASQAAIDYLVNPRNQTAQILHAHFIAIQICLTPLSALEGGSRVLQIPIGAMLTWIENMNQNVTGEMKTFMEWPMQMVMAAKRHDGAGPLMNGGVVDLIMKHPGHLFDESET